MRAPDPAAGDDDVNGNAFPFGEGGTPYGVPDEGVPKGYMLLCGNFSVTGRDSLPHSSFGKNA